MIDSEHCTRLMMHSFMHSGCSGTQHEDCVRLLQRLQSAVHQPSTSSSSENCAAAASDTADTSCELPQDRLDAFPCSMPACSSLLTVQNAETQGRQLAVTQDTAAGTVLWKEEPFVHLLLKQHRKQVCLVLLADRHALQCPAVLKNVIVIIARAHVPPQSWHKWVFFSTLLACNGADVQAAKYYQHTSKLTNLCYLCCRNAATA